MGGLGLGKEKGQMNKLLTAGRRRGVWERVSGQNRGRDAM